MKKISCFILLNICLLFFAKAQDPAYAPSAALESIVKAEYFIDDLTEFGSGTNIPVSTGTAIDLQAVNISTSNLAAGFHRFFIRVKDAAGRWSISNQKQFYVFNEPEYSSVNPLTAITKAEYFFDNLTEFGNGTDIPLTQGSSIDLQSIEINTGSLSNGFHRLYIRTKDASGKWSITNQKQFYVFHEPLYSTANPLSAITKAEYFIDNLTEFGNGTDIPLTSGTSADLQAIEINTGSLSNGFHRLYIRTKDESGKWSITNQKQFYVFNEPLYSLANPLTAITKAEYFIDNLTEFGNGTDIPLTSGTSVDLQAIEINTASLNSGFHRLYIRTQDANGKWSITNQKQFYVFNEPVYSVANSLAAITKAEYFIDNLTEFGNGTDIPLTSGTSIDLQAIEINTGNLGNGFHRLYIRTQDAAGKWSITNQKQFYVFNEPAYSSINPLQAIVKAEYYFDNLTEFGSAVDIPLISGTNVDLQNLLINTSGLSNGNHHLYIRTKDAGGKWSITNHRLITVGTTQTTVLQSDGDWKSTTVLNTNWQLPAYDDSGWGYSVSPSPGSGSEPNCWTNPAVVQSMWGTGGLNVAYLRKSFTLTNSQLNNIFLMDIGCDDDLELYINGVLVINDVNGYAGPAYEKFDISRFLVAGANTFAIKAINSQCCYYGVCLRVFEYSPVPVNDDCSGAVTLTPSSTQLFSGTAGTLTFARVSSSTDCDHRLTSDVWYKFTATVSYHRIVLKNADLPDSMRFQLYGGNCTSLYNIACVLNSHDSTVYDATSLIVGETYYIKVYARAAFTDNGDFEIGIVSPPLSINKGLNILTNASFETPAIAVQAQNMGNTITPWANKSGLNMALIKEVSYSIAFGADTASSGKQYMDMLGYNDTLYQHFSLATTSTVFFSGYFANQGAQYFTNTYIPFTAYCGILDENNVLVAKSDIMNFTNKLTDKAWYQLSGTVYDLPPGNYKYIAFVSDYTNFDNAFVQANFNCPLLSQPPFSISSNDADNIICEGTSITLTANNAVLANGGTYAWYEGSCGDSELLGSGASITLTPSAGIHNYYVRVEESCGYTACIAATVIVNPAPAIISITSNPGALICAGTLVSFTATVQNSAPGMVYQWLLNGNNVGINSTSYSSTTLENNDVVSCSVSLNDCVAVSNSITMSVNLVPSSVTISMFNNQSTTICQGGYAAFTAVATNSGAHPTFKWKKNGVVVQTYPNSYDNTSFYDTYNLNNNDVISCEMISQVACTVPVTSNAITMTVNPVNNASVSIDITSGTNPNCSGGPLTFTATPINGGTTPTYEWHLVTYFPYSNNVVGTNSPTFTLQSPNYNDIVYCDMTSNTVCSNPAVATSNSITVKMPTTFSGYIYGSNGSTTGASVCANQTLSFSAQSYNNVPTNSGTTSYSNNSPAYQWKLNGVPVGTNSITYSQTGFTDADMITCDVASTEPCSTPATLTLSFVVAVYDVSSATLSVNGPSEVCSGTLPAYTANAANAGPSPSYQWKKNGLDVGTNQNSYTPDVIAVNDVITCVLTTDPLCAAPLTVPASNSITVTTIIPSVVPTISIAASLPLTSLSNTFTATTTNGGSFPYPSYTWYKNGGYVSGGYFNNTYTDNALVAGDVIYCELSSNATCAIPSNVNSNELMVAAIPAYCIPTSGSGYNPCEYSWITNVQLGTTLNKTTGCDGLYSNFTTTDTLKAAAGETLSYNILGGSDGTNWYQRRAIYIDFNDDKDFNDAGEMVVDNGNGALNNSTGTFILPQLLVKGSYRLRVVADFDINFSPCNVDGGEVEDYILQITYCTPKSPSQQPACQYYYTSNVTLGNSVNNNTGCDGFYSDFSSLQILTAAPGETINYSVSLENVGAQNWGSSVNIFIDYNNDADFDDAGEKVVDNIYLSFNNPASGSFTLPAFIAFGSYRIRVVNSGSTSNPCELDYGEVEDYTLLIPEPAYCIPVISNPCDMWISNVTIGTINISTVQPTLCTPGGYTDYSSMLSTVAAPGQTINFSLTGQSSLVFQQWQYADIYVDFNNDGDFDDLDERVAADISLYAGNAYTGSFSIPALQPYGYYRMRVKSYNYNEVQTGPCGDNTNGEIEDYRLIVGCVSNGSDISIAGNSTAITDGDTSPDINDHTDFGNVELGTTLVRTFTITNTGTNTLNIGNVTLTGGTNNTAFSIATQPALNVLSAGASTTFSVQFDSPVWGYGFNFNTTVHVASDDCDEADYDFIIQATASCPAIGPEINLQGNGIDIVRFDFTPAINDGTQFGTLTANTSNSRTFTIQNTGNQVLNISSIQLSNYDNDQQFTVTTQPAASVAVGNSTDFVITFNASGSGIKYSYVRVWSDDCDESYYDFKVEGTSDQTGTQPVVLNLTLFLEGFYSDVNTMRANIYDLGISTDPAETDTVTVNLWSAASLSNPMPDHSVLAVVHTDGMATMQFPATVTGNEFYIAVKHRNHIETWSKLPVMFSSSTSYDFSIALAQAYDDGVNPPMASVAGSKFAFYGGDVNQDYTVDGSDANDIEIGANNFDFGYNAADANGDGETGGQDANIVEINANLFLFYARPY